MDKLRHEIEASRLQQLGDLKQELAREEEKIRVAGSRKEKQLLREIEQRALHQAAEFASRLLAEAAGPELENRLFDLLLDGLSTMPADQISVLDSNWGESPESILVSSAYALADDKRHQLEDNLSRVTALTVPVHYEQDAELLAGLNITIGAWVLQLNVRDELRGFTELFHVDR
jgi:F-type H+-transporting ATPase subunit b